MIEPSDGKVLSENRVSRNANRTLARLVVAMEIADVVAIESVRLSRRLKAIAELQRAARRQRKSKLQPKEKEQ